MGWQVISDLARIAVWHVSVDADKFPWLENDQGAKFYDSNVEPMLSLRGQPMSYGFNKRTNTIDFTFFEGADPNVVMMFKLAWAK